jgi:hypothetical protein
MTNDNENNSKKMGRIKMMNFNKCNEKRKKKKKDSNNLQIHEQKENR